MSNGLGLGNVPEKPLLAAFTEALGSMDSCLLAKELRHLAIDLLDLFNGHSYDSQVIRAMATAQAKFFLIQAELLERVGRNTEAVEE